MIFMLQLHTILLHVSNFSIHMTHGMVSCHAVNILVDFHANSLFYICRP